MPHVKVHRTLLTAADRERLLAMCDRSTTDGRRDYALLALLIDHALRPRETLALTSRTMSGGDLVLVGKDGKTHREPLTTRAAAALGEYLHCVGRQPDKPLFVSASGRPLDLTAL